MTRAPASASWSSVLLRLPTAVPWIAIVITGGSLYVAWLNHLGTLQWVGTVVIACCGVLTLACRTIRPAAFLVAAVGGGVAVAMTSREYFAFWGAATALLVTAALAEFEQSARRVPYAAVIAAALGIAGAVLGPAHDGVSPLWPIAMAVATVILIQVLISWARHTREVEDQAADYLHRAHVSEAEATQLKRRTVLAQELHDSLSHHIAAIAVQAEAGQVTRGQEALSTIADLAREALRELEVVLFDLRTPSANTPTAQVDLTLIDSKLTDPLRQSGTTVQVDVATNETNQTLLAAVYRIVQEALTNTLRHAGATTVHVVVKDCGGDVLVLVQDDGVGITPEDATSTGNGMGIRGIRERAVQLGGEADIGPAEPRGTLVRARIPKTPA